MQASPNEHWIECPKHMSRSLTWASIKRPGARRAPLQTQRSARWV